MRTTILSLGLFVLVSAGAAATQHVVRGLRELEVFSVLSAEDVGQLLGAIGAQQAPTGYLCFTGQDLNRYSGFVTSVAPTTDGASFVLEGQS